MSECRGKLISVDGGDRAQVDALAGQLVAWLHGRGVQVVQFSLPTRGPVGVLIRLQAQARLQLDPSSLALLWTADRLDLLSREGRIVAQLEAGMTVVCAQYGWGEGCGAMTLDPEWLERINARCLRPDLSLCVLEQDMEQDGLAAKAAPVQHRADRPPARAASTRTFLVQGGNALEFCQQEISTLLWPGEEAE